MDNLARRLGMARRVNAVVVMALAGYFLIAPLLMSLFFLSDGKMREGKVPGAAYWLHERLTPKYGAWARERVASGRAASLRTTQLVATEWPMFGTVFYVWATEALQEAWDADPAHAGAPPKEYARDTLASCAELIADPGHAGWVKQHWGDDYLTRENAFYRMMLIGGLSTYQKLTGDPTYESTVRTQVASIVTELDQKPSGLLDDYPGECYPADVMAAVYTVRRADAVLGTDHRDFVERMRRAFTGKQATSLGLPPFWAVAQSGAPIEPTRGSANSYACLTAPDLWPDEARRWYALHAKHFWQDDGVLAGFREYPHGGPDGEFDYEDMDSGPIAFGYGFAATAFGAGAALRNGDLDHGHTLLAEMVPGSWPLPDGTLLLPRLLSDAVDAPYLGEACVLYNLTRTPAQGAVPIAATEGRPGLTYLVLAAFGVPGVLAMAFALRILLQEMPGEDAYAIPAAQLELWGLLVLATMAVALVSMKAALLVLLVAQFIPRVRHGHAAFQWKASNAKKIDAPTGALPI